MANFWGFRSPLAAFSANRFAFLRCALVKGFDKPGVATFTVLDFSFAVGKAVATSSAAGVLGARAGSSGDIAASFVVLGRYCLAR